MIAIDALPVAPSLLGESPTWRADEQALYWCDIPGRSLHRFHPATASHREWDLDSEPGCCAPLAGGGLRVSVPGLLVCLARA